MRILDRLSFTTATARWDPKLGIHLDLETNGRPPWEPGGRIAGVALGGQVEPGDDFHTIYIPLAHQTGPNADPAVLRDILALLDDAPVHAFACATEAMWALSRWGVRLRFVGDAYILGRLLSLPEFGLKDLSDAHLGGHALHLRELVVDDMDFTRLDSDDPRVLAYTTQDVRNNWRLERALLPRLHENKLQAVYYLEVQAAPIMAEHTLYGYGLDHDTLDDAITSEQLRLSGLDAAIMQAFGGKRVNLNSPTQLGAALAKFGVESPYKTATGAPSWSRDALDAVAARHPAIPAVIDWRTSTKTCATLRKYLDQPEADGRLHPRWQAIGIHGSARMYAEHPPINTFPLIARAALVAPEGCRWMQVEWDKPALRCLAVLAEDPVLSMVLDAEDFEAGFVHTVGLPLATEEALAMLDRFVASGGVRPEVVACAYPPLAEFLQDVAEHARETQLITSWMHRQWRLQPTETPDAMTRRACTAVGAQSVGTALKVALSLLAQDRGNPLIREMWQLLPMFDRLAYVIPESLPILPHCEAVARAFTLDLGGRRYPLSMRCRFSTGPTLASLSALQVHTV